MQEDDVLEEVNRVTRYSKVFIRQIAYLKEQAICCECFIFIPAGCTVYRYKLDTPSSEYAWAYVCRDCTIERRGEGINEALQRHPCSTDSICQPWHITRGVSYVGL